MPGIAGIVSARPPEECEHAIARMASSMRHRADYVTGSHPIPELGVYTAWTAHRGSFAEHVSTSIRSGISLSFAGECFWTTEERATAAGHDIDRATRILDEYRRHGPEFVSRLSGSFGGLLADVGTGRALLFNDRFGMERLYVYEDRDDLYFASEAKALLSVLPRTRAFDDRGVADYLSFGSVLAGRTLFRDVTLLPGASLLTIQRGARRSRKQYFVPETWAALPPASEPEFEREFQAAFCALLGPYLTSEHRIGISITGGLDTRMIVACGVGPTKDAVCYTFDGSSGLTLDSRLGASVARALGLPHHVLRLGPDFLADFGRHVDQAVYVTDGCAGVLGAHEIPLNKQARELAGIRVTGNFGSEILRSMSTFKPLGMAIELLDPSMRHLVDSAVQQATEPSMHPVTHAAFREIPWHLHGTLCAARSQLTVRTPFLDNEVVRLAYRAPPESRASPQPALRLIAGCDARLARIPTDRGLSLNGSGILQLFRRLFCAVTFKLDYLHKEGLSGHGLAFDTLLTGLGRTGVLGLHKYLPYRRWLRNELAPYAEGMVNDMGSSLLPYWNGAFLRTIVPDHVNGTHNRLRELHAVLTLDAVDRLLLRPTYANAAR